MPSPVFTLCAPQSALRILPPTALVDLSQPSPRRQGFRAEARKAIRHHTAMLTIYISPVNQLWSVNLTSALSAPRPFCFAPLLISSGYNDPNCTCPPYCRCKSFEPCAQACCYRIPSGLYKVPSRVLREYQVQPVMPTPTIPHGGHGAGTVGKGCCVIM